MANPYENWPQASEVCVIGAGTMGAGIAAHLANIGFGVTLLDISCDAAQAGLDRAKAAKPPHFFVAERAADIRLGSIETDLEWVSEADWVCEAVVEKMDVKRELFAKLDPLLRPDTMISTNTSGLQIGLLAEGRSESFRERFLGTHFFNPPRYLKLLELIPTEDTEPQAIDAMTRFLEERVARRVVLAKDTPGFIANRYGMWSMFKATHVAEDLRLTVEQVDAITGPFLGRPRSGTFRLNDLVGLDIMQDIARNLIERCPHDPHTGVLEASASMKALLEKGWIGEKAGRGYYQRQGKELLALDLNTLSYRQKHDAQFDSLNALAKKPLGERVREALLLKDEAGEYLREYLVPTLRYANYLKEEISHSVQDFDRVMMWGFGWEKGPFAMIDAIGADALQMETKKFYEGAQILDFTGNYVPTRPEPQYATIKDFPIIDTGEAHVLRDLGDGVTAFSLTTKMGSITTTAVHELTERLESGSIGRLVLTSEAKVYSVGFDLNFFVQSIDVGDFDAIDQELVKLQRLGELLEQVPSVAAVFGYALGAGFELAVSCTRIAALADTQIGLPEAKVGLIPGGRGTVLARLFNQEDAKDVAQAAMHLTEGVVSANADDARRYGYMRENDLTVYHPDRLIADAKALVLSIKPEPRPAWKSFEGPITGMIDRLQQEAIAAGRLTEYDEVIGDEIKAVFTKSSSYEDALAKEREGFVELCRRALTLARIKHMLDTGKPLRN